MNGTINNTVLAAAYRRCAGLTLLEIMIALLILSIGMLGLAALQTTSVQYNTSAYYRTQATNLAYEFADRMRANRQAALAASYAVAYQNPAPACPVAIAGTFEEQEIATFRNSLACRLPQGTAEVTAPNAANEVTITVRWDESRGAAGELGPTDFVFRTAL